MIDGIIYKLFCKDFDGFYIGSTTDFHKRKISHLNRCNNSKSDGYNFKVYKFIRDHGGFDNWEFTILEEDCEKIRERYWYEHFDYLPMLNFEYPGRTQKEYEKTDKRKEQLRKYNQSDKKKAQKKKYNKIINYHLNYAEIRLWKYKYKLKGCWLSISLSNWTAKR